MTTWTALHNPLSLTSRGSRREDSRPVSRDRRSLAATLEIALEPQHAVRRGLRTWPRIPQANRIAVSEPLREIVSLLRDPDVTVDETALPQIKAFAIHPTSPAFGPHPVRAKFAAYALVDDVRGGAE
jgi:hypothetical protein